MDFSETALFIRKKTATFWRWWRFELIQLLPARFRSRMQQRKLLPAVEVTEKTLSIWMPTMEYGQVARVLHETVDLAGSPETRFQIAQAAFARLASPVALSLPAIKVLRRTLNLPDALEENLKQALTYDLDRHTPFRAEDLYFDVHITGHHREKNEISVEFTALPRKPVDKAMQTVRDLGGNVAALLADPPQDAESPFNLLPGEEKPVVSMRQYGAIAVLSFLLLLLLAAAIALPIWQKRDYAKKLDRLVDNVRTQAQDVENLRNTLDRIVADYDFVLERKDAYPTNIEVLEQVTQIMPDDTWLNQMEIKTVMGSHETQRNLAVRGESENASHLVARLEESALFTKAEPLSQIVRIQQTDSESFNIGAQIKPKEKGERVSVLAPEPEPPPPPMPEPKSEPIASPAAAVTPTIEPVPVTPTSPQAQLPVAVPMTPPQVQTPQTPPPASKANAEEARPRSSVSSGVGPLAPSPAVDEEAAEEDAIEEDAGEVVVEEELVEENGQ